MDNEVKEPAPKYELISPEQYLAIDRADEIRNEYYDGHVIPISGCRFAHNMIQSNLLSEIGNFLKEKECHILPSHMRVSTPLHDAYMYPDALIYCGKPELEDDKFDTLLNPVVIFEILSPSTQGVDKKRKLLFYQLIPSLKEYIMIDSTRRSVTAVRKQGEGSWKYEDITDGNSILAIESIHYQLPLPAIYLNTEL